MEAWAILAFGFIQLITVVVILGWCMGQRRWERLQDMQMFMHLWNLYVSTIDNFCQSLAKSNSNSHGLE